MVDVIAKRLNVDNPKFGFVHFQKFCENCSNHLFRKLFFTITLHTNDSHGIVIFSAICRGLIFFLSFFLLFIRSFFLYLDGNGLVHLPDVYRFEIATVMFKVI